MKPIFHSPKGDETERRFLNTVRVRTKRTPPWFRSVGNSSSMFDAKGVDFRAKIKRRDDRKLMTVPLQIKSSQTGKRNYLHMHPEAKNVSVIVLVIDETMSDDAIREALYRELKPFLTAPRDHFKEYFENLSRRGLSTRGQIIKDSIARKRKRA